MGRPIRTKNKGQRTKPVFLFFVLCSLFIVPQLILAREDNTSQKEEVVMQKKAYFAGGCFWCMEAPFEKTAGVISVDSGYVNSSVLNPTYEQVSEGDTGAYEAIEVLYDPEKVSFEDLLNIYWTTINPTQSGGQFGDSGSQYLTAIFFENDEEKMIAQESKKILQDAGLFKQKIMVDIVPFKNWTRAEEYHQDYYKKNANHYLAYSVGSGRKPFLDQVWGKKPYCPLRKISLEKLKEIQPKAKH